MGASLKETVWNECDLSGSDLREAQMRRAVILKTRLDGASLRGAQMLAAKILDSSLVDASLEGADLTRAALVNVGLERTSLARARMKTTSLIHPTPCGVVDLSGADLTRATIADVDLTKAVLADVLIDGTVFHKCVLAGKPMAGMKLLRAQLMECDLEGVDLTGATLDQCNLRRSRSSWAPSSTTLVGIRTLFAQTKLARASMRRAHLDQSVFLEADLSGAGMPRTPGCSSATSPGANCQRTLFTGADLTYADFSHADVSEAGFLGATLLRARLHRAKTTGARWSGPRRWPSATTRSWRRPKTGSKTIDERTVGGRGDGGSGKAGTPRELAAGCGGCALGERRRCGGRARRRRDSESSAGDELPGGARACRDRVLVAWCGPEAYLLAVLHRAEERAGALGCPSRHGALGGRCALGRLAGPVAAQCAREDRSRNRRGAVLQGGGGRRTGAATGQEPRTASWKEPTTCARAASTSPPSRR